MKKLIFLALSSSLLISCGNNQADDFPENDETGGYREFKIDENKSALNISLFGVFMGTPDYDSVWSVIQVAQDNGLIDSIVQIGIPFEGGVAHCIEVNDNIDRQRIINELTNVSTSIAESFYKVESVSNCAAVSSGI